jgi:hypothetical protein
MVEAKKTIPSAQGVLTRVERATRNCGGDDAAKSLSRRAIRSSTHLTHYALRLPVRVQGATGSCVTAERET